MDYSTEYSIRHTMQRHPHNICTTTSCAIRSNGGDSSGTQDFGLVDMTLTPIQTRNRLNINFSVGGRRILIASKAPSSTPKSARHESVRQGLALDSPAPFHGQDTTACPPLFNRPLTDQCEETPAQTLSARGALCRDAVKSLMQHTRGCRQTRWRSEDPISEIHPAYSGSTSCLVCHASQYRIAPVIRGVFGTSSLHRRLVLGKIPAPYVTGVVLTNTFSPQSCHPSTYPIWGGGSPRWAKAKGKNME